MVRRSVVSSVLFAAIVVLGVGFAPPLSAQNLLVNPDFPFAAGFSGWQAFDGFFPPATVCTSSLFCASFKVISVDCCAGVPENGVSAPATLSNAARYLLQCLPVTAGTPYEFGVWTRRTDDDLHQNGRPYMTVTWFSSNDCSGAMVPNSGSGQTTNAVPWSRLQGTETAPAGALSAEYRIGMTTTGLQGNMAIIDFASPSFGVEGTVPPPVRIPALGAWGLVALAALLGLGGWWALSRRAS